MFYILDGNDEMVVANMETIKWCYDCDKYGNNKMVITDKNVAIMATIKWCYDSGKYGNNEMVIRLWQLWQQ